MKDSAPRPSPRSPGISIGPRVRKSACFDATMRWGAQALSLFEFLTPRDLSACPSRRCPYILLTDEDGGIVNVPAAHTAAGCRVTVEAPDGPCEAAVAEIPWFPAQKALPPDIRIH